MIEIFQQKSEFFYANPYHFFGAKHPKMQWKKNTIEFSKNMILVFVHTLKPTARLPLNINGWFRWQVFQVRTLQGVYYDFSSQIVIFHLDFHEIPRNTRFPKPTWLSNLGGIRSLGRFVRSIFSDWEKGGNRKQFNISNISDVTKMMGENTNYVSLRIHVWYIYLHLVDFMVNVGKYIPYMDPQGMKKKAN